MRVAMVWLALAAMGGMSAAAARPPSQALGGGGLAVGQTFQMALAGTPTEYLFCRGEILAAGERARRVLERARDTKEGPWLRPALAAAMLQRMDDPEEVRLLEEEFQEVERMRHDWWQVRVREATCASGCRDRWGAGHIVHQGERSVPFLIEKLFKQPPREIADPTVIGHHPSDPRGAASCLLRMIGGKAAARAVAVFLLTMPDPPYWWSRGPTALSEFGRASVPDRVLKASGLTDQQLLYQMLSLLDVDRMRAGAVWVLGELHDTRAVAPLVALLERAYSPSTGTGPWLVEAFGKMGEAAIPVLEDLVREDIHTRIGAARALHAIGGPKTVPLLLQLLADSNDVARCESAVALGEVGDPAVVPNLVRALRDHVPFVRESSASALGKLAAVPPEALAKAAESDPDEKVRQAAAEAVACIRSRAGRPVSPQTRH